LRWFNSRDNTIVWVLNNYSYRLKVFLKVKLPEGEIKKKYNLFQSRLKNKLSIYLLNRNKSKKLMIINFNIPK